MQAEVLTASEAAAFARSIMESEGIPKTEVAKELGIHRNNIFTALRSTKINTQIENVLGALGFNEERVYRITGRRDRARRSIYGIGTAK